MKVIFKLVLLIGMISLFSGCEENRRIIEPIVPEGDRVILLEEFTGKGCSNCPKGSREIENLLSIYGDNLAVVSIHAGFFANPDFFSLGQYDLRTDEGEALFDYLGPNSGYPAGVVNRVRFNGELQLTASAWAGFIGNEIERDPEVEFQLEGAYDVQTGTISLRAFGVAKTRIEGDLRMSVMITENDIVDAQDDSEAGGIVEDYVHKHVLRMMLTKFDGESFASSLSAGESFDLNFSGELADEWDPSKIEVIAFVTNVTNGGNDFTVLQAGHQHLID